MRVVISAYACDPDRGSEPGAGWEWTRAATEVASHVIVVTRRKNVSKIQATAEGLRIHNLTVLGHELGSLALWLKRRVPLGTQMYYGLWQAALARKVSSGNGPWSAIRSADVAHHLTFASDWMPAGIAAVPAPLVWGPVGGATHTTWREAPLLRPWQLPGELVRNAITGLGRRVWGRKLAARAAVVLAQNADEASALRLPSVRIHPNVVAEPDQAGAAASEVRRAITVGRLVPLKGVQHIIDALAHPGGEGWTLRIVGDGELRSYLEARVRRLGLADRVDFLGQLPRSQVNEELRRATVYVSASLHEAAGFAVAEAVAHGVHVVYADKGGPRHVVPRGMGTPVACDRHLAKNIARELLRVQPRHAPCDVWSSNRLPTVLSGVYKEAVSSRDH